MKTTLIALLALISLTGGCTDTKSADHILHSQGYTNITYNGYAFWGCSDDDEVRTSFEATSVSGDHVEGVVCCGLIFKACTVRTR